MKIGLFTDTHFSSANVTCGNRYNNQSLRKIEEALDAFVKENCDLVICLGDLTDREDDHEKEVENLKKIKTVFEKYKLKICVIMGNHDGFDFFEDEFYDILGRQYMPQNIYSDVQNIIFIDACYLKNGMHYKPGDSDWTDTFFPKTKELDETLAKVKGDVYIFMHQNIDPNIRSDHRLYNDCEVRKILEKYDNVKTVFQGHYHEGCKSEVCGINYVTYPAMCENEQAYYVVEI